MKRGSTPRAPWWLLCIACVSCQHAPSVDVLGSFFPIWMVCTLIGVFLTIALRWILIRARLEAEVGPRALIYACSTVLWACLIWLIFFR